MKLTVAVHTVSRKAKKQVHTAVAWTIANAPNRGGNKLGDN